MRPSRTEANSSSGEAGPGVAVAFLGKHPAFDDFEIELVGASPPTIRRFNEELIHGGLSDLVDAGKWHPQQVVGGTPARYWSFLRQCGEEFIVGVMAPSSDGKARTRYPLVVLALVSGIPVSQGETALLPCLRETLRQLQAGDKEADVLRLFSDCTAACQRSARLVVGAGALDLPGSVPTRFLGSPWIRRSPETLGRIFHSLREGFRELAPSARVEMGAGDAPCFETLRLPIQGDSEGLADWIEVLRGQILGSVPLFAVRGENVAWVDVIAGRLPRYPDPAWPTSRGEQPVSRTLAFIQAGSGEIPLESDEPYSLDPGYERIVEELIASYGLPWDDPNRVTVFGRAPRGYRPRMPGVGSPVEVTRRGWAEPRFQEVAEGAGGNKVGGGRSRWWLAFVVVGVVVAVLAFLLKDFGSRSDEAQRGGGVVPPVVSGDSNRLDQPGSGESLGRMWIEYQDDHVRWFGAALGPKGVRIGPAFVRTNWSILQAQLPAGAGLAPEQVLDRKDPVDLAEPSPRLLQARSRFIRAAAESRDRMADLLTNRYPQTFRAQMGTLEGTPLTAASGQALQRFAQLQALLVHGVSKGSNGAAAPVGDAFQGLLAELADLDRGALELASRWDDWRALRGRLEAGRSNTLGGLFVARETTLMGVGSVEVAITNLLQLRSELSPLDAWVSTGWARVDAQAFERAWNEVAEAKEWTFEQWTHMAEGFVKGFVGADPRIPLRQSVGRAGRKEMLADLVEAVGQGTRLSFEIDGVTRTLASLEARSQELDKVPDLRRNEQEVGREAKALMEAFRAWDDQVHPDWAALFEPKRLVERERERHFGDPLVAAAWRDRLKDASAEILSRRDAGGSREAIVAWRRQVRDAAAAFESLSALRVARPDLDAGGLALDAVAPSGVRTNLEEALRRDFLAVQLDRIFDPSLRVRSDPTNYVISPEKTNDLTRVRLVATTLNSLGRQATALAGGIIPESLENWVRDTGLLSQAKDYARVQAEPVCQEWLGVVGRVRQGEGGWPGLLGQASSSSRENVALIMALAVGRDQAAAHRAIRIKEWDEALTLFRSAVGKGVGNEGGEVGGRVRWLAESWKALGLRAATWEEWRRLGAATLQAGVPREEWPSDLDRRVDLADLVVQADLRNLDEVRGAIRRWLERHQAKAPEAPVLRQILALPSDPQPDWSQVMPAQRGFAVRPGSGNEVQVILGPYSLRFRSFDVAGQGPVWVADTEVAAGLFEWVVVNSPQRDKVRDFGDEWARDFKIFVEQARSHLNEPGNEASTGWTILGLSQCSPVNLPGGFRVREIRFGDKAPPTAVAMRAIDKVASAEPLNFVSAKNGAKLAEMLGFRFLTRAEWDAIDSRVPVAAKSNLRDQGTVRLFGEFEKHLKLRSPAGLQAVFVGSLAGLDGSGAVGAEEDGAPFLASTEDARFDQGGLRHWRGNVREVLFDGGGYHVAGGSFVDTHSGGHVVLNVDQAARPYVDVGFRFAFDWVGRNPADEVRRLLAELRPDRP